MKTPHKKLLTDYQVGRITSTGFIIDLLNTANRDDLTEILDVIPLDLLNKLRDFVETYRSDMRVFRGPAPVPSAVSMAKELLARTVRSS
jgi:hypothetical protein